MYSLLVGAPRDHSSHDIISRRGAVWKCEFQTDNNCQRIPFRRDGKKKERRIYFFLILSVFEGEVNVRVGTSFDNKTDQWLGASLAANDGNIIVNYDLIFETNIHNCFFLLLFRQVHHFLNIVSMMDIISNMKYQVVHLLENMVHHYQ